MVTLLRAIIILPAAITCTAIMVSNHDFLERYKTITRMISPPGLSFQRKIPITVTSVLEIVFVREDGAVGGSNLTDILEFDYGKVASPEDEELAETT
jgi:hypothetical protein